LDFEGFPVAAACAFGAVGACAGVAIACCSRNVAASSEGAATAAAATLVFFFFPKKAEEDEMVARFHAEDAGQPMPAPEGEIKPVAQPG